MGKDSKDKKHKHKAEKHAKDAKQAGKKAAKSDGKTAGALKLAVSLKKDSGKQDWEQLAKALDVKCCAPGKRKCKGCPLEKKLKSA